MTRWILAFLLALIIAPGVQAQTSHPPAIRPGTYDLDITFGGGVMQGTLRVDQTGDSLTAQLKVGDHDSPVRAGERRGSHLVLESTTPGMAVRYELDFKDDRVSGAFTYNGDNGTVAGKRRTAAGS